MEKRAVHVSFTWCLLNILVASNVNADPKHVAVAVSEIGATYGEFNVSCDIWVDSSSSVPVEIRLGVESADQWFIYDTARGTSDRTCARYITRKPTTEVELTKPYPGSTFAPSMYEVSGRYNVHCGAAQMSMENATLVVTVRRPLRVDFARWTCRSTYANGSTHSQITDDVVNKYGLASDYNATSLSLSVKGVNDDKIYMISCANDNWRGIDTMIGSAENQPLLEARLRLTNTISYGNDLFGRQRVVRGEANGWAIDAKNTRKRCGPKDLRRGDIQCDSGPAYDSSLVNTKDSVELAKTHPYWSSTASHLDENKLSRQRPGF